MGLKKESILLLMEEALRRPFNGKIVTLGKQDVYLTYEELKQLSQKVGYPIRNIEKIALSDKPEFQKQNLISDRSLYQLLGFDEVQSIDASNYENADVLYDLNHDNPPSALRESADVVLDAGTIEHVFHVQNSLKNIFNFLKKNGRIIHISPSSNHMDHGFYMFSPIFFFNYYSANKFDINKINVIRYRNNLPVKWKIATYSPGSYDRFCGLAKGMYAIHCIATKTPKSSFDQIPQQFQYEEVQWKELQISKYSQFKKLIKKIPFLYVVAQYLYSFYKSTAFHKKFSTLDQT